MFGKLAFLIFFKIAIPLILMFAFIWLPTSFGVFESFPEMIWLHSVSHSIFCHPYSFFAALLHFSLSLVLCASIFDGKFAGLLLWGAAFWYLRSIWLFLPFTFLAPVAIMVRITPEKAEPSAIQVLLSFVALGFAPAVLLSNHFRVNLVSLMLGSSLFLVLLFALVFFAFALLVTKK